MGTTVVAGVQGGVCLVVQDRPQGWRIESTCFHRPNVVSCKVVTVTKRKWNPIISAYLPTSTLDKLTDLEEDLTLFQDHNPIVLGYLSANIVQCQNLRSKQVDDLLMGFSLMDLLLQLEQRWRYGNMKIWYRVRQGNVIWARSDYILGTDWHGFKMVGIRGVRKYPSDNFFL